MRLAEIQALFHALVTSGEVPGASAGDIVLPTPGLPAAERIGIYAGMYAARLVEALRADFPKLAGLLGDTRFALLGEAYARAHPSDHPDIGRFGRRLAGFLRLHPEAERPDLADLAALEWARSEVFFEADILAGGRDRCAQHSQTGATRPGPPLAPGQPHPAERSWRGDTRLASLGSRPPDPPAHSGPASSGWASVRRSTLAALALEPEVFGAARPRLAPALRLVRTGHDVAPLWRALEAGEAAPPPALRPAAVAVWRSGFDVFHAALEEDEAAALGRALAGEPLAHVCEAFGERADAAQAAFEALSSWVDDGWVAGIERPRAPPASA